MTAKIYNVLFLCTSNSARSHEALLGKSVAVEGSGMPQDRSA
jgi:protein-tyrosine-phosphatase